MTGLPGRFYAEDFGALGDDVTDDWQALTAALAAAGHVPVILRPGATYRISQTLVLPEGGFDGLQPGDLPTIRPMQGMAGQFDCIRLEPPGPQRRFCLRHLVVHSGLNCVHAYAPAGAPKVIYRHSVFEDLYMPGAAQAGFFVERVGMIGVTFKNLHAETCGGAGIHFHGESILNAAQIINARAVFCKGAGFHFENTRSTDTPAVNLFGLTAEWNDGPGIIIQGYHAVLHGPHFEGNDNDASGEPDLLIGSSSPGTMPSRVLALAPYFGPNRNPQNKRIGWMPGGDQFLTLVHPHMSASDVIDSHKIQLQVFGGIVPHKFQPGRHWGVLPGVASYGCDLTDALRTDEDPFSTGIPASCAHTVGSAKAAGGALKVLASRAMSNGGGVAEYIIRRNETGTITPQFVVGEDFLVFGVDANGLITVACPTGKANFRVEGF